MEYSNPQEPYSYQEIESWDMDDVSPMSHPVDRKQAGGQAQNQTEYNQLPAIDEIPLLEDEPMQAPQHQQYQQQQNQQYQQDYHQQNHDQQYQQDNQQQQQNYQQQQQNYQKQYQQPQSPGPIDQPAQLVENGIQPMDHAPQPDEYDNWQDEDDISPMSRPIDRKQTGMSSQTQATDPMLEEINSIPMLDDAPQQQTVPIINPPQPAIYSQQPTTYDPQPATYSQQQSGYNQQQNTYSPQQNGNSPQPGAYSQQPADDGNQPNDQAQAADEYDSWHDDEDVSPRSVPADRKQNTYVITDEQRGDVRTPLEGHAPLEARSPLEPTTPMEIDKQMTDVYNSPMEVHQPSMEAQQQPMETYQQPIDSYQQPMETYQHPMESYQQPMDFHQKPLEDIEKIPALDINTEYSTEPEPETPKHHKFSVTSEMDQFSDASSYSEPDEPMEDPYKNATYRLDLSDDDDDVATPLAIEAFTAKRMQKLEKTEPFKLTHPNGVTIFPGLTTSEQEEISKEALAEAEEYINVDSGESNYDGKSDAGYESEGGTFRSTSLETSVRDYMYENGRRYHKFREGTYNFPNDDVEQEREDMKHAMVKMLCSQKLHFAPVGDHPQEVLDIGTGTGIWAIEMGDHYASANVLGVDLSPIQPEWVPPNVRFMIDDIESAWLYPRNSFDYIHARHTVMAIKDYMRLFRRAYEHLRPGGWIELQEIHHSPSSAGPDPLSEDNPVARYWSNITEGLASLGVDLHAASGGRLAAMMHEAGFTNVTERVLHVPIGTWPRNKVLKTVGLYWRTILQDGVQAIALGPLTRGLGWSPAEVELFLVDVRKAYNDNSAHLYMPFHVIYAQKPIDARL